MRNLETLSLVELSVDEMRETEGKWWQAGLAIAGAVIYVYNNYGDFVKGFKEGLK